MAENSPIDEAPLRVELVFCEPMLLKEIADPQLHQRDVAQTYALTLQSRECKTVDWLRVNKAIIGRWSLAGLKRIKRMAHSGKCFEGRT